MVIRTTLHYQIMKMDISVAIFWGEDMKKTVLLVLALLISFTLGACMSCSEFEWKVCRQPNTKWESDDESIVFSVNDSCLATGTMNVNGEIIEVFITEGPPRSRQMFVYPLDVLELEIIPEKDRYEYWICSYESENEFMATVEETTFYEVGQRITFNKIESQSLP